MRLRRKQTKPRRRHPFILGGSTGHTAGTPYRPRRLPPLTKPPKLTLFLILLLAMLLGFSFAHIWKAHAVSQVCLQLDTLRNRQQDLLERLKAQQLTFQDITLYPKIEPLAREVLGMHPAVVKPVVIAPLHESVAGAHTAADVHPREKRN